ncbi:MAG: hypothetical protein Q9195_008267 [Heterodermia aff. obscurata]
MEDSMSPTKLQRRPYWQRADDVLVNEQDIKTISPSQRIQESQRGAWQSANKHREAQLDVVCQKASPPNPRAPYSRSSTEELILRESLNQLEVPLQCPVIMCEKLFHFRDDFEYHKAQAHRGQRLSVNDDGSFAILDPKTNGHSQDISYGTFICEDCGDCFSGGYGLAFHKSRSPKCGNLSETHPALLAYQPTDRQSLPNEVNPSNLQAMARDPSREQTRLSIRDAGTSLGSSVQEVNAAVSCEQEKLTSNTEVGRKINPADEQRISKFSGGIPLKDLGLSTDSSNDEDFMLSSKNHLRPEPNAKLKSSVSQMSSAEAELTRINGKDTKLLFAAEAMVEARFARVKYALIAEVMRANGAEEYKADLIEKELPRLNGLAGPYAKSGEEPPAVSRPAEEKVNEITADLEAKISAQFTGQTKALTAANREELNETLKKLREDINNVRESILEKVTDVFRPDTQKNNHGFENLNYQTSDRASQTTRDATHQPLMAQYPREAQPQDEMVWESPDQQLLPTSLQQHHVPEQYSAIRSAKEPQSTAKENENTLAKRVTPRDRNVDSARRTSARPYDENMDPVIQKPTSHPHGDQSSQRKHSVPYEPVTDLAKQTDSIVTCRKCNKSFDHYGALQSHLRSGSHFGPFPPPVVGSESTAAATEASTKPKTKGQCEIKAEGPAYPSLYRPNNPTEMERGPPQLDGARDMVGSNPDPAAQLLPPGTRSTPLANRVNPTLTCQACYESFESKKLLHGHLVQEGHQRSRGDRGWLSSLPTGPKKARTPNPAGSEKKSQALRR